MGYKNVGKVFEQEFQKSLEEVEDMYVQRLKDNPMTYNTKLQDFTRFTLNNPYDYYAYKKPHLYCFELKSTEKGGISIAKDSSKQEKGKMIKYHQIKGLYEASKITGVHAGFIFNFRENEHTYYYSIQNFLNWLKNAGKMSINEKDVLNNGGIIIEQHLVRVSHRYDIQKFLDELNEVK